GSGGSASCCATWSTRASCSCGRGRRRATPRSPSPRTSRPRRTPLRCWSTWSGSCRRRPGRGRRSAGSRTTCASGDRTSARSATGSTRSWRSPRPRGPAAWWSWSGTPTRTSTSSACRPDSALLLALLLGDLAAHRVHVDGPHLADEVLQRRGGQRAGLGVEHDAVAHRHQRRDRRDAERLRELDLRLGVDLAEGDVLVGLRGLLEDGRELVARPAPLGPEVDEDGAV